MLEGWLDFLNINSTAMSVFINVILVSVTSWYAFLTYRLTRNADKTIEYYKTEYMDKKLQEDQIKNNLLNTINHEIYLNYIRLAQLLLFLKEDITKPTISAVFKHLGEEIKITKWNELNALCVQHIDHEILEEIIGYYAMVEELKTNITINFSSLLAVNDEWLKDFISYQCTTVLLSSKKCINFTPNIISTLEVEMQGKRFNVNDKTGVLEEII